MIMIDYMWKKQENTLNNPSGNQSGNDKLNNYRYLLKNLTKDTI